MKFEGTAEYVATPDLTVAVNAAIALERPLLVKGEPGTGKTELARQIAASLGLPLLEWHVKSTTKAAQGLYEYDAVSRLRDSQLGEERVHDVRNYIRQGPLWRAFEAEGKVVLLIDEIDKADIEFPNDLLQELDRMEFFVYETGETVRARQRPIVVITSNNEKELPDAFLRRCFFHYIRFPDEATLTRIVEVHFPRHQAAADPRGADPVLRDPRDAGAEEEALDLGGARLAEAAARRGPGARGPAPGRGGRPAAAARGAPEERAGRAPLRAPGLHGARPPIVSAGALSPVTPCRRHAIVHRNIKGTPSMFTPFDQLSVANAWIKFAIAFQEMSMAAGEVILRRSMRMSQGKMTGPEAVGMVMEKATAFAAATERAAVAAATGADPARIASAALKPIRAKTRSNARKYRR